MRISSDNIDAIAKALNKQPKWRSLNSTLFSTDAPPSATEVQDTKLAEREAKARAEALRYLRGEKSSWQKVIAIIAAGLVVVLLLSFKARANVVGSDVQNFNPTTSGLDFVTVHSSETLEPGVVNVGFFLNFAVNTMPNYENKTTQQRTKFEDNMLGGDINFGVGLAKDWDFGVSFPQVYAADSKDNAQVYNGKVAKTGLTEIRLNSKYRLWGDQRGGFALIGTVNFNRVEDNPFTGSNPGPTYNFEAAWDTTINRYAVGVNVGYRKRNPGTQLPNIPIVPYEDSFIASAAVSYLLTSVDTKLIAEIYGSFPTKKQNSTTDRDLSTLELLLGIKKDWRHDLAFHAGAGTELYHGSSTPDWRLYTGVNWNFGPLKKKSEAKKSRFHGEQGNKDRENFVIGDILFDTDSDVITPEFQEILRDLADYLRKTGFKELIIEGHTDSVGSAAYNLDLSQRRANSAKRFLVEEEKLPANKIKSIGYGEERPIADNENYQGRARNRRIEFNISR